MHRAKTYAYMLEQIQMLSIKINEHRKSYDSMIFGYKLISTKIRWIDFLLDFSIIISHSLCLFRELPS